MSTRIDSKIIVNTGLTITEHDGREVLSCEYSVEVDKQQVLIFLGNFIIVKTNLGCKLSKEMSKSKILSEDIIVSGCIQAMGYKLVLSGKWHSLGTLTNIDTRSFFISQKMA